jgi:hypothetical protein
MSLTTPEYTGNVDLPNGGGFGIHPLATVYSIGKEMRLLKP